MPRIEPDLKLDFKDVLIRPKRSVISTRAEVELECEYTFRTSKQTYRGVPIMAANMDSIGTLGMARVLAKHGLFTCACKHCTIEEWVDLAKEYGDGDKAKGVKNIWWNVGVSTGLSDEDFSKTKKILNAVPELQSELVLEAYARPDGRRELVICNSRCPGDVAKAFGAGADFVMLGGLLAGHDQTVGPVIEKNGRKYKLFYGISSKTSMEKYDGEVASHRAVEGRTIEIPYRGDVGRTVQDILGGVRSTCSYTGAKKLQDLSKVTTFVRVTQQVNEVLAPFEAYV